jgi:hypothetical protein
VAKDTRIYVRASEQDQSVFRAVAEALGQSNVSAAIRLVMHEKARELGLRGTASRTKASKSTPKKK